MKKIFYFLLILSLFFISSCGKNDLILDENKDNIDILNEKKEHFNNENEKINLDNNKNDILDLGIECKKVLSSGKTEYNNIADLYNKYKEGLNFYNKEIDQDFYNLITKMVDKDKETIKSYFDNLLLEIKDKKGVIYYSLNSVIENKNLCPESKDINACNEQREIITILLNNEDILEKNLHLNNYKRTFLYSLKNKLGFVEKNKELFLRECLNIK